MKFDDITGDGRLWAVKYDGESENILTMIFRDWNDLDWLEDFFRANAKDLDEYFHITNVTKAIYDTLSDADELECLIMDMSPSADLDRLFRPLDNNRTAEMMLGKEKAKGSSNNGHASWLRLYAIKFEPHAYLLTGGAIKLTYTMEERAHTLLELSRMETVRNYLLEKGVTDLSGFYDYIDNEYETDH